MVDNCWRCGKEVQLESSFNKRVYCNFCKKEVLRERQEMREEYERLSTEVMIENAICILEKGNSYVIDLRDEIKYIAEKCREDHKLFNSAPEVAAGIILYANGVGFKKEYKIGRYRVDFFIPSLKVVLEIDGDRHANKVTSDGARDASIRQKLGSEFEVIRIPVPTLEIAPHKLIDAIKTAYFERKKLRSKHRGILTHKYSRTENAYYDLNREYSHKVIRK